MPRRRHSRRKSSSSVAPVVQPTTAREKWLGTQPQLAQLPLHTPQGMSALEELLGMARQGLQDPMQGFEPIKQNILNTLQQETIPSIAQRFASMGSGGALTSSGLQGALGQALENIAPKLAALGSEYGLKNRQGLLDMLQLGLTPQYETTMMPGRPGHLENWLLPGLKGLAGGLNFVPGVGSLLANLAQAGIGGAEQGLQQRRMTPNVSGQLSDWLKSRRSRSQTYSNMGTLGSQMPYGTTSMASLPGGY